MTAASSWLAAPCLLDNRLLRPMAASCVSLFPSSFLLFILPCGLPLRLSPTLRTPQHCRSALLCSALDFFTPSAVPQHFVSHTSPWPAEIVTGGKVRGVG